METHFYVYMTTNLINGKTYIGKRAGRLDDNYIGSGKHLNLAIQKYGKGNFKKAILEVCDSDEHAYEREAYWVERFDAVKNPNFYNLCSGGTGTGFGENSPFYGKTHSNEARRKMSEAHKGKTLSDETRRKVSENNARHWKGKTRSLEARRKMSEAKQNMSSYTRKKISEARKGKTSSAETRRKLSEASKGENNPQFKHRPDITKERIESLFAENPSITKKGLFQNLNIGWRVFTRIINDLYGVPTFTELKRLLVR
jgi:group I intron endonuclease